MSINLQTGIVAPRKIIVRRISLHSRMYWGNSRFHCLRQSPLSFQQKLISPVLSLASQTANVIYTSFSTFLSRLLFLPLFFVRISFHSHWYSENKKVSKHWITIEWIHAGETVSCLMKVQKLMRLIIESCKSYINFVISEW